MEQPRILTEIEPIGVITTDPQVLDEMYNPELLTTDPTSEDDGDLEPEEDAIEAKDKTVNYEQNQRPVIDLINARQRKKLDLFPSYQRERAWDEKKASFLVESILLNVPIPLIFTAVNKQGVEEVIDGQQRLTSIFDFCANKITLKGLKIFKDENGKKFTELTPEMQDQIHEYSLSIVRIKKDSPDDVKFEIFERINSGAVNLNAQELRNCIYRGKYNDFIKELSLTKQFVDLVFPHKKPKRLENAELVLRFFAFYKQPFNTYKGSLKTFLNRHMELERERFENLDEASLEKEKRELKALFLKCIALSKSTFGDKAFLGCSFGSDKAIVWNPQKNKQLFDIVMHGFTSYDKNRIAAKQDVIRETLIQRIVSDEKFLPQDRVLGLDRVRYRFTTWLHDLQSILEAEKQPRFFNHRLKEELFKADATCQICSQRIQAIDDASLDHIQAYVNGGRTVPDNAQLAHRYCNSVKSAT